MKSRNNPTAAMIAIGDELLSGRTRDKNIAHLASFLSIKGIDLLEVRIIADDQAAIVNAVNTLRAGQTYLFTSGGIGPTHDDITSEAIAAAFQTGIDYHPEGFDRLQNYYASRNIEFTTARKRMARIPNGASLIDNAVSVAPGFQIENVYVMAGVPAVFNAMLLAIEPKLEGGEVLHAASINCNLGEGTIGDELAQIAANHPQVSIGSYPQFDGNNYTTQIVLRSRAQAIIDAAREEISLMIASHSES